MFLKRTPTQKHKRNKYPKGRGKKRLRAMPPASSSTLKGLESNQADRQQLLLSEKDAVKKRMAQVLLFLTCKRQC